MLCAGLGSGCRSGADDRVDGLPAALARELALVPAAGPRLSIAAAYRSCDAPSPGGVFALRNGCGAFAAAAEPPSRRVADLAARAARAARAGTDPRAMHAAGLVDLVYESGVGKSLQRAISLLRTAARLDDRPAPVLADLSAAYLVRAERGRSPRDLLAALDAAEQAVALEPRNRAALFNRALAVHALGLVEEAAHDWRAYLAIDRDSPWADEARRRLGELQALAALPGEPAPDASPADFAAYARAEPQGARTLGWCRELGAWGSALLAGDAGAAEARLARAEALGTALAARAGGDASLAQGVDAIRRAGPGTVRRLAEAHREFAAGCALEVAVQFPAALPRYAAAAAAADGSPLLRAWARLSYGGVAFRAGRAPEGEAIVRRMGVLVDSVRYPALTGRARAMLASLLLRGDRYEPALQQAEAAARLFHAAGEGENEAGALVIVADAHLQMGDPDAGWRVLHPVLRQLQPYRRSNRLHNALYSGADAASAEGLVRAAVRLQDEGVRVAERTGKPIYAAEARVNRARLLAAAGALPRAGMDVAAARAVLPRLPDGQARWLTAQLQWAQASTTLRGQPGRAAPGLDSAAAFFRGVDAPIVALPAVVEGARAWLAAGDPRRGTDRLQDALAIMEQRRDSIRVEPRRAAVFETARAVVDRVTMLRLAAGRPTDALAWMDRGRASLATAGIVPDTAAAGIVSPAGAVAVEYALVGDTLLAWTVSGYRVELYRTVVDTARLVRTVDGVLARMENGAPLRQVDGPLAELYDLLIRPIQGRLGGVGTPVVVIADGELAGVPFAALRDARRGRWLLEDHPLRFAASLREARRPPPRPTPGAGAVFVADPAFDAAAHPGFVRLPGAAAEVSQVAAGYARPRLLSGAGASAPALRAALGRASVLHYAGHAVFDDERPERSYLLLAPAPGAAPTLQAGEIAEMDLRHVSLVVLSACETVRTGRGRASGFSGLAGAFLAAGAAGAVGSLWEVEDGQTRRLMTELHAAYRTSGNGADALRTAQLRLLRSGDPRLSSPSVWAAFRYTGS